MTSETFYLFITIYLIAITVIGLGVGGGIAIYLIRQDKKASESYEKKRQEFEKHQQAIRAKLR